MRVGSGGYLYYSMCSHPGGSFTGGREANFVFGFLEGVARGMGLDRPLLKAAFLGVIKLFLPATKGFPGVTMLFLGVTKLNLRGGGSRALSANALALGMSSKGVFIWWSMSTNSAEPGGGAIFLVRVTPCTRSRMLES